MSQKNARSLDIGFGQTKGLAGYHEDGSPNLFSFPSVAPRAAKSSGALQMGSQRNTVVVAVDGIEFEVGPDATDLISGSESRILHDQYVFSDQYKALFLGALYWMDVDVIDYLQLGLPVNMMQHAEHVRSSAVGEFEVGGRKITVKEAGVIEQPLGGYEYYRAYAEDGEDLEDEVALIIDPGYHTFDWVVVKDGRLIEPRSDAVPGGVSRVLSLLAKTISEQCLNGREYTNLEAIDKALRKKSRKLRIFGTPYDLNQFLSHTAPAIDGPINQMRNIVGDLADIDRVILMSGGAEVFKRRLSTLISEFEIEVAEAGRFANVLGYQEAALKRIG